MPDFRPQSLSGKSSFNVTGCDGTIRLIDEPLHLYFGEGWIAVEVVHGAVVSLVSICYQLIVGLGSWFDLDPECFDVCFLGV